jgi:hypothetical protein
MDNRKTYARIEVAKLGSLAEITHFANANGKSGVEQDGQNVPFTAMTQMGNNMGSGGNNVGGGGMM